MDRILASFLLLLLGRGSLEGVESVGPQEYAARRGKVIEFLRAAPGGGLLLLRAKQPAMFTGEIDYPYRPLNDLYYLTGIDREGIALVLTSREIEGLGSEVLFFPPRSTGEGLWISKRLDIPGSSERSGIPPKAILGIEKLPEILRKAVPGAGGPQPGAGSAGRPALYFDQGPGSRSDGGIPEAFGFLLPQIGLQALRLEIKPPKDLTSLLREVKSKGEVPLIERAAEITCRALRKALREARPGVFEYQLAATIECEFRLRGAGGWSFPSIVASGPNSCILHYDRSDRQVQAGDLVLMDIGAEYGYYAADVTRTVPASGRFTERQRRLYQVVFDAQEAAIRSIRPGIGKGEVNRRIFEEMGEGLVKLGLIQEIWQVHMYLPHPTSHGIGLDVHEPIASRALEPGMVVTVEPGVYIPAEGIGIRIEDDVLVTETGFRLLSGLAPRSPEDVERWISGESF